MYENVDEVWSAWTAGIMDGEGCLTISASVDTRSNATDKCKDRRRVKSYICVRMTDYEAIQKLYTLWGGTTFERYDKRNNGNRRLIYGWRIRDRDIIPFLTKIMPYLVIKRRQAELLVELRNRIENQIGIETICGKNNSSRWISDEETNERMRLRDLVRKCNIKGGRFPYVSYYKERLDAITIS